MKTLKTLLLLASIFTGISLQAQDWAGLAFEVAICDLKDD